MAFLSNYTDFKVKYRKCQICKLNLIGACLNPPEKCQFCHSIEEINLEAYNKHIKEFKSFFYLFEEVDNLQTKFVLMNPEDILMYKLCFNMNKDNLQFQEFKEKIKDMNSFIARFESKNNLIKALFDNFFSFLLAKEKTVSQAKNYLEEQTLKQHLQYLGLLYKYQNDKDYFDKKNFDIDNNKTITVIRKCPSFEECQLYYQLVLFKTLSNTLIFILIKNVWIKLTPMM